MLALNKTKMCFAPDRCLSMIEIEARSYKLEQSIATSAVIDEKAITLYGLRCKLVRNNFRFRRKENFEISKMNVSTRHILESFRYNSIFNFE